MIPIPLIHDSGRMVGDPVVIQRGAPSGSVPRSRPVGSDRDCSRLTGKPEVIRYVLELARARKLPGLPIGNGVRRVWRFRLSELASPGDRAISLLREQYEKNTGGCAHDSDY